MARYWVYLNGDVKGPYSVEELVRLRGFSRQTQVCVDDRSGHPQHWMALAEIPELAHIFRAAELHHAATAPEPSSKPAAKPQPSRVVSRTGRTPAAAGTSRPSRTTPHHPWVAVVILTVTLSVVAGWWHWQRDLRDSEKESIRSSIAQRQLPAKSAYGSLQQYFSDKQLQPRWEYERASSGLENVTVSWYDSDRRTTPARLVVLAFEVNRQAQSMRGLNTAAVRLLSEGLPHPPVAKAKVLPPPKKTPQELFSSTLNAHAEAVEKGDFGVVWNLFSRRKHDEMSKGGISRNGYLKLHSLTYRADSAVQERMLKTKSLSDNETLVLLLQKQPGRADVFVKQLWVFEDGAWKLDDEEKRSSAEIDSASQDATLPNTPKTPKLPVTKLPGMSN